jgi:peptidoglycan hydrolase CwlO-like protein
MAGNRVDELETKVRELEATIDGLTDELVETKERLQALESDADGSHDILEGRPTRTEAQQDVESEADETETESPADDGEASADDVNTDEADEEDNADSESGDDIIVA